MHMRMDNSRWFRCIVRGLDTSRRLRDRTGHSGAPKLITLDDSGQGHTVGLMGTQAVVTEAQAGGGGGGREGRRRRGGREIISGSWGVVKITNMLDSARGSFVRMTNQMKRWNGLKQTKWTNIILKRKRYWSAEYNNFYNLIYNITLRYYA